MRLHYIVTEPLSNNAYNVSSVKICDQVSPKSCLDLFPARAYNKQCDKVMGAGGGRKEEN